MDGGLPATPCTVEGAPAKQALKTGHAHKRMMPVSPLAVLGSHTGAWCCLPLSGLSWAPGRCTHTLTQQRRGERGPRPAPTAGRQRTGRPRAALGAPQQWSQRTALPCPAWQPPPCCQQKTHGAPHTLPTACRRRMCDLLTQTGWWYMVVSSHLGKTCLPGPALLDPRLSPHRRCPSCCLHHPHGVPGSVAWAGWRSCCLEGGVGPAASPQLRCNCTHHQHY